MLRKRSVQDVARNRLKSDPNDKLRKALRADNITINTPPKGTPPAGADYSKGRYTRNGRVVGYAKSEDSPFYPAGRKKKAV
jgi:hypothetical protein